MFDTVPLEPHFVGGTLDQNWCISGPLLPWDSGETLQLLTCGRTSKDAQLVLVLNELQDVLSHPLGLSHPCATSTEQGLFPQGTRKENTLHTILLRP